MQIIINSFTNGEFDSLAELVKQSMDQGTIPSVILEDGLIAGIREVVEQFRGREWFTSNLY